MTDPIESYRAAETAFLRALTHLVADLNVPPEDRQRVAFGTIGAGSPGFGVGGGARMNLHPSIRFTDATGTAHVVDIPAADTIAALERGIDNALRVAAGRNPVNPRIEIHDVETGRLVVRRVVRFVGGVRG